MDLISIGLEFIECHDKGIIAICSFATLILAVVVFVTSNWRDKKSKQLINELKIALIMIATNEGGADIGKRMYDEYEKKFLEDLGKGKTK